MFRKRKQKAKQPDTESSRKLDLTEVVDLVKAYARQELIEPLRPVPRWMSLGLAGSVALMLGTVLLSVALLRALQTETGTALTGNLSWIPYLIVVACLVVLATLLLSQINKRRLQ